MGRDPAVSVICIFLKCRDGESGLGPGLPAVQGGQAFNYY